MFLLGSCRNQSKIGEAQIKPTVPTGISSLDTTLVNVTPSVIAKKIAISTPEFPIRLPCNDGSAVISDKSRKVAIVCREEMQKNQTRWDVQVNNVPVENNWVSLLSPNLLFENSPSVKFSPDGSFLAVAELSRMNNAGIVRIFRTSDWKEYNVIHYNDIWKTSFRWTSDSRSIVVTSSPVGKAEDQWHPLIPLTGNDLVYLISIDGQKSPFLSEADMFPGRKGVSPDIFNFDFGPVWSPDGRYIGYLALAPGDTDDQQLVLINTLTNQKEIVYEGKIGDNPTWSPDGKKILFYSREVLQIFDLESRTMKTAIEARKVAKNSRDDLTSPFLFYNPLWLGDSRSIVFEVGATKGGTFVVNIMDNKVKELSPSGKTYIQLLLFDSNLLYHAGNIIDRIPIE